MAKIIVCNFILNQCVCIFVFKPFVDKIAFVYICVFGSVGLKLGVGSLMSCGFQGSAQSSSLVMSANFFFNSYKCFVS